MDWASSQWKQELPPSAVQKINALEEKIERLQKERQQKQLQCECLELALEKEKRKVENEKQQTTASQRELQSLADTCKDFENKQQRLQNEIQNRDNRITSLEQLLSQAKNENCRLQQVENDLKELRGLREATLLEKEQTNESYTSGQNVKLLEKKVNLLSESLNENSEISISAEKDNSKYTLNENSQISSLSKKISDQEKIIQELKLKLLSISDKESNKECQTDSKTPGRPQMEPVEASPAFRTKSVWGSFTSTPAKENKDTVLRHYSDSSTIGSSDEKLIALQTRLKQLCQELDCQRHNFEASKVSMEQKFKEKENVFKAELKYQAQANADLDKELKDMRNKYQQEITQSTKKLDLLTAQMKKTEEAKTILEKEVKTMESKICACTLSLKTKEEEIQNLQKLRISAETTVQSLQAQVQDLERKYKNVKEQNSSLSETIKAVELQLDGSCNLAQEREADLAKVKKELENRTVSHTNLLNENQDLQNRIVTVQRKSEELLQNEFVLKEQFERMEKEQNQLTEKLNVEMKKSQDLAFTAEAQKSQISLQKEELSLMESKLTQLNRELTDTKLDFEGKMCDLGSKLNHVGKENEELIHQIKECSTRENLLTEKLERTENEKTELLNKLGIEIKKLQEFEMNMAEDKRVISHLRDELSKESAKNNELSIQLNASEKQYEAQIQQLEMNLNAAQKEYANLEMKFQELKQELERMSSEKEEAVSQVIEEKTLKLNLESSIVELNNKIKLLEEERACEYLESDELKEKVTNLQTKIQQLEMNLNAAQKENANLEMKFQELKQELERMSSVKEEAVSQVIEEKTLKLNLESSIVELNNKIKLLEEERACESLESDELKAKVTNLQAQLQELERKSSLELMDVQKQLETISSSEKLLSSKVQVLEKEKEELNNNLAEKDSKTASLLADNEEKTSNILSLQEKLSAKSLDFNNLNQTKVTLTEELKAKIQQLEMNLNAAQKENANLEIKFKELKQELEQKSSEKEESVSRVIEEKSLRLNLESSIIELNNKIKLLEEERACESLESDELKKKVTNLQAQLQELERKSSLELMDVQKQLETISSSEKLLSSKVQVLEKEKEELNNNLAEKDSKIASLLADNEGKTSNILSLQEKLSAKSLDFNNLNQTKVTLTEELKAKIQQLEMNLNAAQKENANLEIKFKELKQELEQKSSEKEKSVSRVIEEKSLRLNLESSIIELNNKIKLLEEERACESLESDELKKKVTNLQAQLQELERKSSLELMAVQKQLESVSSSETLLSSKLQDLEKDKEKLNNNLAEKASKIESLLADNEEKTSNILSLQEELSAKSLEFINLNQTQVTLTEELKEQLNIMSKKEKSLLEEVNSMKKEKDSLSEELYSAENELQKLRASFTELKRNMQTLNKELTEKSSELDKIQNQVLSSQKDCEVYIQELQTRLVDAEADTNTTKNQIQSFKENELTLLNKIDLLNAAEQKIKSCLHEEICKRLNLELIIEGQQQFIHSLEHNLSRMSEECGNIDQDFLASQSNYEINIQELENQLSAVQEKYSVLKNELDKNLTSANIMKGKLKFMEEEKAQMSSIIGTESSRVISLQETNAKLHGEVVQLREQINGQAFELSNVQKAVEQAMNRTEEFQNKLVECVAERDNFQAQIDELLKKKSSSEVELQKLVTENQELTSGMYKTRELEKQMERLTAENMALKSELDCKSLLLNDLAVEKAQYENKNQDLQNMIMNVQRKSEDLLRNESVLKEQVELMEKEQNQLTDELNGEMKKSQDLAFTVEAQKSQISLQKEELSLMESKLSQLNQELTDTKLDFEPQVEEQENILQHSLMPGELHGSFSEELSLEGGSFPISSLEANLSLRTFELDELSVEKETLKEEFERAIRELQAEVSENDLLRVKVKDALLNAEMLQKRLELVEKQKQDLDRQLNFENKKIKMLESGIQELKKIILTLQVLLISYNGEIKGLNTEMASSKDSSEFEDEAKFKTIYAVKECMSTAEAETQSFPTFYFPEFKSFSSLPEKEFSAALEKFSFYSLNQICYLENNLKSKLERCKFLCNYQLVDKMQLDEVWKIFLFLRRKLRKIQLLKKFMICFCNILKSSLVAHILHCVNKVALVKVFPKNFAFTLKDFLYLCNNAFNKILFSVSQTFEKDVSLVNQHSDFFNKYSNIHYNAFHLPVIQNVGFVWCQARFRRVHWSFTPKHVSTQKLDSVSFARRRNIKKALEILNAQEAPFFLNFTMSLMEEIGKGFCRFSNNFTAGNFSMSSLQMKNYLSLSEPSSPLFQILSKYCIDILNLENVAVHDICYWKHHCNISGIDKCDVQKMITLLEHMDKHRISEGDTVNTGSENQPTKVEVTAQKSEESLDQYLKIEKEKQNLLNIAIEEIEKDLGETFLQKEKFKNMALNVSKMLVSLKKSGAESFPFSNIQLERGEISTETCFCENCIMDEGESDKLSHNKLTLNECLKCIDRLIGSGCQLEEELKDESELKALSRILKDKNSELEMTLDQLNKNLETANNQVQDLKLDLQAQKEKYEYLSQSINEKDTWNMQLEAENSTLLNSIDEYKTKLKVLEEEVSTLSINQEKLEFSLGFKDREFSSLKATFDENVRLLNEAQMKCKEYRNEIDLLSSRISKYEEEKMIDQHMVSQNTSRSLDDSVKSSKTIVNEMQAKIDSLTKSNNSLNLTIENIEEELRNVYMEKKNATEKLGKLSEQIACFKREIAASSQKYNDEKRSNETLLLKLKEYEKLVLDNEHIIKQLKAKNEILIKNDNLMKTVTIEHEQVITKKNSDLTRCHQAIEQLQKQNAELKENFDLKVQTKVAKKQESFMGQLNEIMSQKSKLEKEIKRLKLVETEKVQIVENLSEANLQNKNLSEQLQQIALEFKIEKKKNTDLEIKCNELSSSLKSAINSNTSLEEELNKNKTQLSILNKQFEESSIELKKINCAKCELITEVSTLKSVEKQLTQKIEALTKSLKDASDNLKAESNKNHQLMRENETLKINGNVHAANIGSKFQKLRNTFNSANNFIVNVLNTVLCAVQSYPENKDFEELRSSLMEIIVHCKQNSEKELQVNVINQLSSFFGILIGNHKDDLVICELVSSIKDSVTSITTDEEPCQGAEASLFVSPDTICNMSVFQSNFVRQANNHSNILADLKFIKAQTDEIILNFKRTISKKTEEIEKLKELKQLPFISAKNESEPKELNKTSFKWKYEFTMKQYRRLEAKYNEVVISSEDMEKTIKKLEEENKSLDREAEELSNEIKNLHAYYNNSDELMEALGELNALRPKLKELQRENEWLKEQVQRFQLQQASAKKTSSSSSQRETQIPKFDKTHLKENNLNRFMKGS